MTIFIRHDSLPMQTITVGRASALNLTVIGVPANVENVLLHVSTPGAVETYTPVAANPGKDGRWSIYAPGIFFPEEGLAKYHITGRDDKGNSVWFGGGRLYILQSVLNVDPESLPIVPEDTYLRNPSTGLWHKLTVNFENGMFVPEISNEGVSR